MLEGLPEGLARIFWKGKPYSSLCRWASSSQDHRADSSRVVYDDVPYEKVQVSTASWLIFSHHSGPGSRGRAGMALQVPQLTLSPPSRQRRSQGGQGGLR